MKIVIDENLKGKELFKFLIENKSALVSQKKSMLKKADAVSSMPTFFNLKDGEAVKADAGEVATADVNSIRVKVVANTAYYCDSQMDVLLPNSAAKSIKERKGLIPHLHDHIHELDAEVGDVQNIYYEDIPLTSFGVKQAGYAQALIFETDIKKSYNEKVFNKYKAGKVRQHSIGLQYSKIELAVNDEESEKEFDFWNKHIDKIINREVAEEKGFFWVVSEYKLLENSAVLFGSNSLTPTLLVGEKQDTQADTTNQPDNSTDEQPSEGSIDIKQLINNFQKTFE